MACRLHNLLIVLTLPPLPTLPSLPPSLPTVVGFDIIELWTADAQQKLSCTYVHATKAMLRHRPNIIVGHYPNHKKAHRVSPKLCEKAKQAKGRYYWDVKRTESDKLEADYLECNIHTEMATYLETDGVHIYIVGFVLEKLPFKTKWVKFIAGLSYAIYVAAFDLDDEDDEGKEDDPGVDYSLNNKSYMPRAGSEINFSNTEEDAEASKGADVWVTRQEAISLNPELNHMAVAEKPPSAPMQLPALQIPTDEGIRSIVGEDGDKNPFGLLGLEIETEYNVDNLQIIQGRGRGGSDTVLREELNNGPSVDMLNLEVLPHPIYADLTTVVSQLSSSETGNTMETTNINADSTGVIEEGQETETMTDNSVGKNAGSGDEDRNEDGREFKTCMSGGDLSGSEEHMINAELDIVGLGERGGESKELTPRTSAISSPVGSLPDMPDMAVIDQMQIDIHGTQAGDVADADSSVGVIGTGNVADMFVSFSHVAPTWDPVDVFSFPVAEIPVIVAVPDNLVMEHFTDIQYIADGSNANIFLARLNDEKVIIKMIKEEIQANGVAMHEFNVEHGLLSRISHPNIIKLVGAGRTPRRFIVLEWLGGGTLSTVLSHNQFKSGLAQKLFRRPSFTYTNLLSRAKDVADALSFLNTNCHKGATIIHRDLKPDNVGFTADGQVKLFDFGLCTLVKSRKSANDTYSMTGNTGSLRYMAPEVALKQPYNEKADVYSFGIMVWQMARDRVPFKGMSREEFMARVVQRGERPKLDKSWPSAFSNMLESCWSADHTRRPSFQELSDLLGKLQSCKASLPVAGRPVSPTSPSSRSPASKQTSSSVWH